MSPFDFEQVARELVRALRGRRSQSHASRLLGYRSNVVFDWESGRRSAPAHAVLGLARRTGVNLSQALATFSPTGSDAGSWARADTPRGLASVMRQLKGKRSIATLATEVGVSRYQLSRWLSARTRPGMPELLAYVQATTLRMLDFLAQLSDPQRLPSVAQAWQELSLSRELAYEQPWSHAVLRALETQAYRRLRGHRPGFIANLLGISRGEEEQCLSLLSRAGQIHWDGRRFSIAQVRTVDTQHDAQRSRQLRAFWSRVAAARHAQAGHGEVAFNLFGVSDADLQRLVALQRAYFQELRSIVAQSEPVEHVVLASLQLVPLGNPNP